MTVRVRIAPSPTGEPHIGTAYVALVNQAFARKHGGQFIIRIEDTDQTRSTRDSEDKIFESLRWLGFEWDEGPDVGGPYGPYRQSDRKPMYGEYSDMLLEKGHAFKCFCTADRLELMRASQRKQGISPKYDGHCTRLTPEDVKAKEAAGESFVVRMKVPNEGMCTFTDGIYGDVSIPWADVDMQVLMKSDGMPTYHMANVVDDHLMKITHVIRGEEWVSSTPKHILLYRHFGWDCPEFTHLPVLRNLDRTKLSKRKNPTSITWFRHQGYLKEAVLNYLGYSYLSFKEGDEEITDLATFNEKFAFENASKAGAVFDLAKLDWLNARWIREKLTSEEYMARVFEWANEGNLLAETLKMAQTRMTKFSDLPQLAGFMFAGNLNLTPAHFAHLKTTPEQTLAILTEVSKVVDTLTEWNQEALWNGIKALEEPLGQKAKFITAPLFVAMTGAAQSLPLMEVMATLGRSVVRARMKAAVTLFEGVAAEAPAEA